MKYFALSVAILMAALSLSCGSADSASNTSNKQPAIAATSAADNNAADLRADQEAKDLNIASSAANTAVLQKARRRPPVKNVIQKTTLAEARVAQEAPTTTERKVIRNADLLLEAAAPADALDKIAGIAEAKGGFVVETEQNLSDLRTKTRDSVSITLRVPADRFADALDEIRKTGDSVINESVKGEDVTEEFIDVEARLKAQKALEQQYLEIMKRAYSVEDALYVQSELAEVRGEIEKIEGRKRYLENQSSLSTIKVKLQTSTAISANSKNFGSELASAFGTGLDFALNFVLGLVTILIGFLPFALFIVLPGVLIGRFFWRRSGRPQSVEEIAKSEIGTE